MDVKVIITLFKYNNPNNKVLSKSDIYGLADGVLNGYDVQLCQGIVYAVKLEGSYYKVNSDTLAVVSQSLRCIHCQLTISKVDSVMLEAQSIGHFRFYGYDGDDWVLFTKDHHRPKQAGGSDDLSNLVTCCQGCNNAKGSFSKSWDWIHSAIRDGRLSRFTRDRYRLVEMYNKYRGF